ncbi:uncharacterized protein LOC129292321 [Prosopis cineraria]|uniref:uncharacterized protein LOC129292321 n=1 Tax=Prosopis cineraria TaxID=364024 RepID=UPI00240F5877|nr:uncharacterized protein LOC129292321 [Prosopis cineraria]
MQKMQQKKRKKARSIADTKRGEILNEILLIVLTGLVPIWHMQVIGLEGWEVILEGLTIFEEAESPNSERTPETQSGNMAEDQYDTTSVNDFANWNLRGTQSCIRMPEFQAHTFEIKPAMITMLQMNGVFHGLFNEDANKHLMSFVEDLENKFRARFFSDDKTVEARDEFLSFKQYPDEHLYAAWERYKMLMKKCPNHGMDKWVMIQIFCNRLNPSSKAIVDSITNGGYQNVSVNEVFRFLDQLSVNNTQNTDRKNTSMVTSAKDDSSSQIVSILKTMNKHFDVLESQMQRENSHNVHAVQAIPIPLLSNIQLRMRNHPNFSWSQGNSSNQPSSFNVKPLHPSSFQAPPKPIPVKEEEFRMEKIGATKVVVDNEVINEEIMVEEYGNLKNNQEEKKNKDQAKKVGDKNKPQEAKPKYVPPLPFPQRLRK